MLKLLSTMISNIVFLYLCYRIFKYFAHESPDALERQRKDTPLSFDDGVSYERFQEMARNMSRRFKTVDSVTADRQGIVRINWHSNRGKTFYEATLDFNDHGHLTGRFWKEKSGGCEMPIVREIENYFAGCIRHESRAVPATS